MPSARGAWIWAGLLLPAACATPQTAPRSGLAAFEHTLAAQSSATAALGQWCGSRAIADPPIVTARRTAGARPPAFAAIRELLDVDANQTVAYRHVRLSCGARVLSTAHNWYVPSRLTPAMNDALEHGDTPFGKIVAPLGFVRERLASRRGAAEGCPAGTVLSHRALLRLPGGQPISVVVECYTGANLR